MTVYSRFAQFLKNLSLTQNQIASGKSCKESVVQVLNSYYWNNNSKTLNSKYVGSWSKFTRIRPPRDVDVLFELPASVRHRFDQRLGNRQSQLLQEVRTVLISSFSSTNIRGDGPVVAVPFSNFKVELIPCFQRLIFGHDVCITAGGGYYKREEYQAQIDAVFASNQASNGNTRDLIRMAKCWQGYCNVPLKSFHLELCAMNFISGWGNAGKSKVYYDWMVRDFFAYLLSQQNRFVHAPATGEAMFLGSAWHTKAQTAYSRAIKACNYESINSDKAGDEWQKVFGWDIPKYV